jgi:hypothetical protein
LGGEPEKAWDEGFQNERDIWKASPVFTDYWVLEDDHGGIWLCTEPVVERTTAFVSFQDKREFASMEAALMAARMK